MKKAIVDRAGLNQNAELPFELRISDFENGMQIIEEGDYGNIKLTHQLRKTGHCPSKAPCLHYLLSGTGAKQNRFPANKIWVQSIYDLKSSSFLKKNSHWLVALPDAETSRRINTVLVSILKQSILGKHADDIQKQNRHYDHRRAMHQKREAREAENQDVQDS